jgi:hypothetical protein
VSLVRPTVVVFLIGILFAGSMLIATGGRPALPLDDSFIYFQYARQVADGAPFVYQNGDAPTTGATSLPWMFLLSLAALLGFGGKSMILPAMLLGGALLVLAVDGAGRTQRVLAPRKPGSERPGDLPLLGLPLAGALVALCGPLHWGAWSGMEIALFTAAIVHAYRAWCEGAGRPTAGGAGALALLALVRPEGILLAGVAVGAWALGALRDAEGRRSLAWALVPVAAMAVIPLVSWISTGDPRSAGFTAKSILAVPGASLTDALRVASLRAMSLGGALFGGRGPFADGVGLYAYDSETAPMFVAPGAFVLFAIGILPALAREWGERRPGPGLLGLAWIATLLFATCLLEEPDAHYSRYQMPILPVFLVWIAIGVGRVARITRDAKAGFARIADGVRLVLAAFGLLSVLFFAGAFGDNAADIDRMQIALGEALREELGADQSVAINDAGAIAYFSHRRTVDLIGLTTPGFAGLWSQGSGALWERLESMERRPDVFAIFPNWFDLDGIGLLRRRSSVRRLAPSIVDAEKVVYAADWSMAGSGDAPRWPAGSDGAAPRVLDRLDVADVASEAAHGFTYDDRERGGTAGTFVRRATFASGADEIVDGVRTVLGGVAFDVRRDAFRPATLVVRTVTGIRQRPVVRIDGSAAEPIELYAPGAGLFHDQAVAVVPPGNGTAHVVLEIPPGAGASPPLVLAHVFVVVAP